MATRAGQSILPGVFHKAWIVVRMIASIPQQYKIPFWPRHAVESLRNRRLRETVQFAHEAVPYYRRLMDRIDLNPSAIREPEDLGLLPVVLDEELRDDPLQFVSNRHNPGDCYQFKSGGTTGVEKQAYHDLYSLIMNVAYSERQESLFRQFLSRRVRYRCLHILAPESTQLIMHGAYWRLLFPFRAFGPQRRHIDVSLPFKEKVKVVNEFRPGMISGYSLAVAELYDRARRERVAIHCPELIKVGGESLPAESRRMLEKDFGIPVLMTYQSNESLKIGYECEERKGYHLHEDLCIVRVLDEKGRSVPDGESGRVVVTNLLNRATILINFDQGDVGTIISRPCRCGRTFRRLELHQVRDIPLLKTLDGGVIHSTEILLFISRHPEVEMVQVIVERPDFWRVGIVSKDKAKSYFWLNEASRIIQQDIVGSAVTVQVEFLEQPEQTNAGKTLPVIILCPDQAPYV